jgi:indolepyruvate ferredoxin oxidoreductase beta subunit
MRSINFLLVGVGGQGTILASNILAEVGLALGYDVKKAEVHGMSQRGGSVTSHVRWAEQVFSPIFPDGEADVILAFEKMEAGRFIASLRPGGLAIINDYAIVPVTVHTGKNSYPSDDDLRKIIKGITERAYWVDGVEIAEELGNTRVANVVLLGVLASLLNAEQQKWPAVIERLVPAKAREINLQAFARGGACYST